MAHREPDFTMKLYTRQVTWRTACTKVVNLVRLLNDITLRYKDEEANRRLISVARMIVALYVSQTTYFCAFHKVFVSLSVTM